MPENVIGARASDVIHHKKTAEGSLTVTHNTWDLIANTWGHLAAIPTRHLLLWTPDAIFRNPPKELATKVFERWKDVPWKGDVLVRVGHTDILQDMQRIWNIDKIGGPYNLKVKNKSLQLAIKVLYSALAIPLSTLATLSTKFIRANHYNPMTNTVNIYHPHLGIGMHEMGHAEFYNLDKHKTAYAFLSWLPIIRSFTEYKAHALAMPKFKDDVERRHGLKVMEAMWGTYLTTDALLLAAPFAGPVGMAMATAGISALDMSFAGIGGAVAGHFMNRGYPKREQRFGYVFEGKTLASAGSVGKETGVKKTSKEVPIVTPPTKELSAHQVLVATARAPKVEEALVEGKGGRQFSQDPLKHGKRPLHSNTHRITF